MYSGLRVAYTLAPEDVKHMSVTKEQIAQILPPALRKSVNQKLVDQLNNIAQDPDLAEEMRQNFISYSKVLQEGRFKLEDYLNAVKFVSYKLMGYNDQDAFFRAFPQRHQRLLAQGADPKTISAHVSMYKKGKLVNLIMEQAMVPVWVLNQDAFQKAINVQVDLMMNAKSEMVRTQAANSLLTHLQRPKEVAQGPLVNINVENSGLNELKAMIGDLAQAQKQAMKSGVPTNVILAQKLSTSKEDQEEDELDP